MPTRLSASGRGSRPFSSLGSGSGSVFALRIFCAMVSASSVRLMRELSDESDFDIFLVPSRKLITRVAGIIVEFLRDVARQLEMLLLVLADRHMGGAIEQNIGRHQHRVIVETHR